jgi:hypothetical protein
LTQGTLCGQGHFMSSLVYVCINFFEYQIRTEIDIVAIGQIFVFYSLQIFFCAKAFKTS